LRPNELSYWTHMKLWKQRGARLLDMGGGGDYKRKYGGREIAVPWFRQSKNAILPILRYTAERMFRLRQRVIGGRLRGQHKDENANSAAA